MFEMHFNKISIQVINHEIDQVEKACLRIGCRPHITFIIVTKKHNLRLYRKVCIIMSTDLNKICTIYLNIDVLTTGNR